MFKMYVKYTPRHHIIVIYNVCLSSGATKTFISYYKTNQTTILVDIQVQIKAYLYETKMFLKI